MLGSRLSLKDILKNLYYKEVIVGVTKLVPASEIEKDDIKRMAANKKCQQLSRLLLACSEGDRGAFRRLYDLSARQIYGIVFSITRDRETANEVAQETFVRIWRRSHQYNADGGSALSWISTIARNCAVDRIRSERARGFIEYTDELPEIAETVDRTSHTLECLVVHQHLNEIRPEYKKALLLCYFHGYTYDELAAILDVPTGTAKSWVNRGLASLRKRMQ